VGRREEEGGIHRLLEAAGKGRCDGHQDFIKGGNQVRKDDTGNKDKPCFAKINAQIRDGDADL